MKTAEALPQTDSIQELAQFWDNHDLTDFEDELEEVTEPVFDGRAKKSLEAKTEPFTEGFEIVSSTLDEDKYDWEKEEYRSEYLDDIVKTLGELGVKSEEVTFERTGVGVGASADAIALIMAAGLTVLLAGKRVFLSGKTINENLDAWIELAKKLRNVLKKVKANYVSQPFAAALALEEIIKSNPNARMFDLEASFIEVVPNSSMDVSGLATKGGRPIQEVFRYQQMRYYLFVFRTEDMVHVICVRSTGKIEFHHALPVLDWMRF